MRFVKESVIPASVEAVFAFHERPDAFALLSPPWEPMRIHKPPSSLAVGTRVELESRIGPFWIAVEAEHIAYVKNERFEDVMRRGPFRHWHHRHVFEAHPDGCLLRDDVEYEPPLGWLGALARPIVIEPRLRRMFEYRHRVTAEHVLAARAKG